MIVHSLPFANTRPGRWAAAMGLAIVVASCGDSAPASVSPEPAVSWRNIRSAARIASFGTTARNVVTSDAIGRAVALPRAGAWQPGTPERPRGANHYPGSAPAVVVVRTSDGHGSGFLVTADGVLITNNHVVQSGLKHEGSFSIASVHLGRLGDDGVMTLAGDPIPARLLKVDRAHDLAMLRLDRPAGAKPLPFLRLAAQAPLPGTDCAVLGHPSSGMLWTYRPCQVSAVGGFPKDMVNLVLARLSASGAERAEIESFVEAQPDWRIMLTSAQVNPGDSGGPVIGPGGTVIGVTFAGPGDRDEDKFTYHVHLDELRAFLADIPTTPTLLVPDPWDFDARVELVDLDGDGKPDMLAAGSEQPEVLLFDLDNDSPAGASPAVLVRERRWDFEAAIDLRGSGYASFYDVANRGRPDLILVTDENSMEAKGRFRQDAAGTWRHEQVTDGAQILAAAHLRSPELAQRFERLLNALNR